MQQGMPPRENPNQVSERQFALRSIERPNATVRVLYQDASVLVALLEVSGRAPVSEPQLWGRPSWHFVLEGLAIVEQQAQHWALLREESLQLDDPFPFTIANRAPGRLRLLTLLFDRAETPGGTP